MKGICVAALAALMPLSQAWAWGQEGHSIVADIAQRALERACDGGGEQALERGSLASVASWADDIRNYKKPTGNWHFVDIPIMPTTSIAHATVNRTRSAATAWWRSWSD